MLVFILDTIAQLILFLHPIASLSVVSYKKEGEERRDQTYKTHPRPAGVSSKKLWYLALTIWTFSCIFLDSSDIFDIRGALSLFINLVSCGLPIQQVPLKSHYLGKSAVSLTIPLEQTMPLELIRARCVQVHKISASRKQFLQQQKAIHPAACQVAISRTK